ncbi:DNA-binding protein [Candidatus Fukatsuia anoeciicola]|uniref:DNA-binding protein n=1 Tax=Candidatus Fukatsuia anoeciicola TaxID=2994492 RepID=UPI003464C9DE
MKQIFVKKVSIIAKCLVNTKIFTEMATAELLIKKIFNDSYSEHSFDEWNTKVSELSANRIIAQVATASKVRVRNLIQELWYH